MRQHLLIDADDTLWENNIYFEQAFAELYSESQSISFFMSTTSTCLNTWLSCESHARFSSSTARLSEAGAP